MEFANFTVTSTTFDKAILQWDIAPTHEDLSNYSIVVYRGEDQIHTSGIEELDTNTNIYEDALIGELQYDKLYNIYYSVALKNKTTGAETLSHPTGINQFATDWVGTEIIRRDKIYFENVIRVSYLWLKIKSSGEYCPKFDITLGQHDLPGDCMVCYNTNWVGGYYAPYKIFGSISSDAQNFRVTPNFSSSVKTARFVTGPFPEISINDLIIDRHGTRWRVGGISGPESKDSQFRQYFNMQAVDRSDPVYKLPIDFTLFN